MIRRGADIFKHVLTSAAEEAVRRGDRRLGTDHLLLALLHEPESPGARCLGVSLAQARAAATALDVAALAAVGVAVSGGDDPLPPIAAQRVPPLSSGARAVLGAALSEARSAKTGELGTKHFLVALLARERPDPAAELMQALGVDPGAVRERLAVVAGGAADSRA